MDFWIYIDDSSGFLQFDNEYCVGGRNHKQGNSIKLNAVFSISLASVAIMNAVSMTVLGDFRTVKVQS